MTLGPLAAPAAQPPVLLAVPALVPISEEERRRRVHEVADRMARSFANAVIENQNRPENNPLWQKVVVGVFVALIATIFLLIIAFLAILFLKSIGLPV